MAKATKQLTIDITEKEFDNGYWYADEIKSFAKRLGIVKASRLRKDELELLIKHFLRTGQIKSSGRKNVTKKGPKDIDIGLKPSLPIINYTSNKTTKTFITTEASKVVRELKIKSGVWYRLNRWRDTQITQGKRITYGDLINQFIILNQTQGKFEKVAVGRYINFLSDFLTKEKRSTRQQGVKAWKKLKLLNIEKTYAAWRRYSKRKS